MRFCMTPQISSENHITLPSTPLGTTSTREAHTLHCLFHLQLGNNSSSTHTQTQWLFHLPHGNNICHKFIRTTRTSDDNICHMATTSAKNIVAVYSNQKKICQELSNGNNISHKINGHNICHEYKRGITSISWLSHLPNIKEHEHLPSKLHLP